MQSPHLKFAPQRHMVTCMHMRKMVALIPKNLTKDHNYGSSR